MISTAAAGLIALVFFRWLIRPSLSMIRGPPSPSFIFGNILELYQRPVGETEFAWQSRYGNVVRFKSIFGVDQLLIADSKALYKILNASAYSYPRIQHIRVITRLISGKGLLWADGDDHKRQKSILLPGFGSKECKAFLPIFKDCAESISVKWMEMIGTQRVVINVHDWLMRGSLDAIGHAAFDVQFNTVQDDSHPFVKKYRNYFGDIFGFPSALRIFLSLALNCYIPEVSQWLADNGRGTRLARARDVAIMVTDFASDLVNEKADAVLKGQNDTGVFTLLPKANMDANAKKRLSDEELFAQVRTLLGAGQETTATTMAYILLELAKNSNTQAKLRDEIRKTEGTIHAGGDLLTASDLGSMPYLNAVIKEGLRLHPVIAHSHRVASRDDTIPLSKPLPTMSGRMVHEIFVPKGTEIVVSVSAYNRDQSLWGEDAHNFRPDRWLDGTVDDKTSPSVGVYSNLLTFHSGARACIGWRFALIEIQMILFTLVGKFEFGMTDKAERIVRLLMIIAAPMVEGEFGRGVQVPLAVSLAPQDDEM